MLGPNLAADVVLPALWPEIRREATWTNPLSKGFQNYSKHVIRHIHPCDFCLMTDITPNRLSKPQKVKAMSIFLL